MRYLIVNADDFGLSLGVNHGIIAAHEHGIVTSASLMVRWPAAAAAAGYARSRPELGVGLHLDLGEWVYRDDGWVCRYQVVPADDPDAVRREAEAQLARFRDLLGRDPTHLDSHQHAHRDDPARTVLTDIGRRLGVPVRHFATGVRYCGAFYGQTREGEPYPAGVTADALVAVIHEVAPGVTELACHPGLGSDSDSVYRAERADEVRALCDARVREAVSKSGTVLESFAFLSNSRIGSLTGSTPDR